MQLARVRQQATTEELKNQAQEMISEHVASVLADRATAARYMALSEVLELHDFRV